MYFVWICGVRGVWGYFFFFGNFYLIKIIWLIFIKKGFGFFFLVNLIIFVCLLIFLCFNFDKFILG